MQFDWSIRQYLCRIRQSCTENLNSLGLLNHIVVSSPAHVFVTLPESLATSRGYDHAILHGKLFGVPLINKR